MKRFIVVFVAFFVILSFFSADLQGITAFARKHNLKCTNCHSVFPKLNATGRAYKLRGYRLEEEVKGETQKNQKISNSLIIEKKFPVTALVKGYAFDKKKDKDQKTRPFHELELMIGGNLFKNMSAMIEIEAEDEGDFKPGVELGVIGWNLSPYFNVVTGYGPYFWEDPYDTMADGGRRLTRAHKAPFDITSSYASGVRLRKGNQFMSVFGKYKGLYYSAGYHRDLGDPEGAGGEDFHVRAAYEFTPEFGSTATNISVGGFGLFGKQNVTGGVSDFTRAGFDLQAEIGDNLNVLFFFLSSKDDFVAGGSESNTAWYGEFFWVFYNKEFSPTFVPLVRLESYQKANGSLSYTDLTANISYMFAENVKLTLEYWANLSVPAAGKKGNRITAQFIVLL